LGSQSFLQYSHRPSSCDLGHQKDVSKVGTTVFTDASNDELNGLLKIEDHGRSKSDIIDQWWLLEWGLCLVSVLSIVAIVLLLIKYDHQPLPNWPRHITINSLIPLLGTVSKAMMLIVVSAGMYLCYSHGSAMLTGHCRTWSTEVVVVSPASPSTRA